MGPRARYLGKLVGKNKRAADDSRERMLTFFVEHSRGRAAAPDHLVLK